MREPYDRRDRHGQRDRHDRHDRQGERGIPDGLLVGLLAFFLGLSLLVWTATGLAGVMAHGAWPRGVTFGNTPPAMRALISAPQDLPAAWPDTPAAELSGYGLFWGLAIGELMVLVVLTVFALGTFARWRAVRAATSSGSAPLTKRRPGRARGRAAPPTEDLGGEDWDAHGAHGQGQPPGRPASAGPGEAHTGALGPGDRDLYRAGDQAQSAPHAGAPGTDHWDTHRARGQAQSAPHAGAGSPGAHPTGHAATAGSGAAAGPNPPVGQGAGGQEAHGAHGNPGAPADGPTDPHPEAPVPVHPAAAGNGPYAPYAPYTPPATVPAPRAPESRVVYGDRATRRPAAVQAVLDAEGPALVVTSDPTVWAETKDARAKLGPVLVYDPGHLCDTPARLHWSPTTQCEDAATAQERAAALLAPVRPRALLDAAMADTAETLLRCWLHAAAVDGRPFKQVHRWAQGTAAHDPVRILRTHPKATAGLAGLLESALTAHPERREIAQALVARALSSLSSIHIREACTANRTDALTLESFIDEGGTLYLVGEPIEDPKAHPGAMPLLTALASSVVEHGRRMAARSSDGRLDPPMTLVLDDIAAVAPLPLLPELLATGHGQGLPPLALLRSAEQARARWSEALTP